VVVAEGVATAYVNDFTRPTPGAYQAMKTDDGAFEKAMRVVTFSAENVPAGTVTDSTPLTVRFRVCVATPGETVDVLEAVAPGKMSGGRSNAGGL
jgi:hypothetical protein